MVTHTKVYRFRLQPTPQQSASLGRLAGSRRWVWNWALGRRKAYYQQHGKTLSNRQLSAELTRLKRLPETRWLSETDSQLLQQAMRDLDGAFSRFFKRQACFPRFKSRKRDEARFRIPQRVRVENGRVYVPKVGWVRIRQSMLVDLPTKSATFKRNHLGQWFVSLTAHFDLPDVPLPPPDPASTAGIDLGLKDFAVLSTGERIAAPKFYRKAQSKLRHAQKRFCRRQKGSHRRAKARLRVARIHNRVSNQRRDFLHQLTTRLVRQYRTICLENLCLKGLARTKLAKSFLDAAHGEFRRQIEYKTKWYQRHLVVVDRFYPSSKLHAACGEINTHLTLADREWVCGCGVTLDRDLNAACNIRDEGLRMAVGHTVVNARGGDVRRPETAAIPGETRIPPRGECQWEQKRVGL